MELKYGDTQNYKWKLEENKLKWLVEKTNRSLSQTQFLYNLVDGDFEMLKKLEEQLKNCFVSYCPDNLDELTTVMNMKPKSNKFKL
jgi:hypothetical protein